MDKQTVRYIRSSSKVDFLTSGAVFGVVVARMPVHQNLHSGVVYRRSGPIPRVGYVHVKWDHCLGESWGQEGVWASPATLNPDLVHKLLAAAELADKVWRTFKHPKPNGLPYGIGWNGSTFEYRDGQLTLNLDAGSVGLTCATLPLAICKSSKIDLVAEETWEGQESDYRDLVAVAEALGNKELKQRIDNEINAKAKRIRPEQVTAAAAHADSPIDFSLSVSSGEYVVSILPTVGTNGGAISTRVVVTVDPTPG